jgi:hypothetical protein
MRATLQLDFQTQEDCVTDSVADGAAASLGGSAHEAVAARPTAAPAASSPPAPRAGRRRSSQPGQARYGAVFATGSGIVTMARQVGIVLGVAILVTVLGAHAAGDGARPAFQRATIVLAGAAAAAALVSLLLVWAARRERRPRTAGRHPMEGAEPPARA